MKKTPGFFAFMLACTLPLTGCGGGMGGGTSENSSPRAHSSEKTGGVVTVTFYNPDLSGKIMTNATDFIQGNGGARNDSTIDVDTLKVQKSSVLVQDGNSYLFTIGKKKAALAVNWPTAPSGWGMIILDNQGKGFSGGEKIIFNYQAALDYKLKLDNALKARPDYVKSEKFKTAYDNADKHIKAAQSAGSDSVKGTEGQKALNELAAAYDTLLYEYGPYYAAKNIKAQTPMLAVTIDRTSDYQSNLDTVARIASPYAWIRLVFDVDNSGNIDVDQYRDLVNYAEKKGIKIVGQPCDSFYDKRVSTGQYLSNLKKCVETFPEIDMWEVGNEVNGSWLSPQIGDKIKISTKWLKEQKKATMLTVIWTLNTVSSSESIFNWIDDNVPDDVRNNIDVIALSQYQEMSPMGMAYDQAYTTLSKCFPKAKVAMGELGYWIEGQTFYWAYDEKSPLEKAKQTVCGQYYRASLGYKNSVGGCFWWTFCLDMNDDEALQKQVSSLRDYLIK